MGPVCLELKATPSNCWPKQCQPVDQSIPLPGSCQIFEEIERGVNYWAFLQGCWTPYYSTEHEVAARNRELRHPEKGNGEDVKGRCAWCTETTEGYYGRSMVSMYAHFPLKSLKCTWPSYLGISGEIGWKRRRTRSYGSQWTALDQPWIDWDRIQISTLPYWYAVP